MTCILTEWDVFASAKVVFGRLRLSLNLALNIEFAKHAVPDVRSCGHALTFSTAGKPRVPASPQIVAAM